MFFELNIVVKFYIWLVVDKLDLFVLVIDMVDMFEMLDDVYGILMNVIIDEVVVIL